MFSTSPLCFAQSGHPLLFSYELRHTLDLAGMESTTPGVENSVKEASETLWDEARINSSLSCLQEMHIQVDPSQSRVISEF